MHSKYKRAGSISERLSNYIPHIGVALGLVTATSTYFLADKDGFLNLQYAVSLLLLVASVLHWLKPEFRKFTSPIISSFPLVAAFWMAYSGDASALSIVPIFIILPTLALKGLTRRVLLTASFAALIVLVASDPHGTEANLKAAITASVFVAVLLGITRIADLALYRERENLQDLNQALESAAAMTLEAETARKGAEKANLAKTHFLSSMSHEVRTPLNGIFGSLQVIRSHPEDTEIVAKYSHLAMQSYRSVLAIVNDVLDLAKLTENKIKLYPEPCKIEAVINQVISEFNVVALNKGLELSGDCSAGLSSTNRLVDVTRVEQILRNLISNAIKYTDSGSVSLRAETGDSPDEVVFIVSDTGVGIPPEYLESIFQPFEQVEPSRGKEKKGTGLGLAITEQLIDLMSGSVEAVSEVGLGTTMTVRVSLPPTELPTIRQKLNTEVTELKPARILHVEDGATNRMIFKAILSDYQLDIDEAFDGEQGLKKALTNDYDLIVMDIQMPVMDGLAAMRALKAATYEKPVIACTANVMKDDVLQYIDEGFHFVVGKPYLKDDLVRTIHSALARVS